MLVKKFEARTMKEALEMVKKELGPDAIILSARDHKKSFGLVGSGSFEITAAVPAEQFQKKKYAESRMKPELKDRLVNSSAKIQKEVIEKSVQSRLTQQRPNTVVTGKTSSPSAIRPRYIDIPDENGFSFVESNSSVSEVSKQRIKSAAQNAWSAMNEGGTTVKRNPQNRGPAAANNYSNQNTKYANVTDMNAVSDNKDLKTIESLKSEIEVLRKTIAQFQQIPQNILTAGHIAGKVASVYPGSDYGLKYEVAGMFEKLLNTGMSPEIIAEILTEAQEQMQPIRLKNPALVDAWVAKYILDHTLVAPLSSSKVQVFMGPSACGKTSTLVKYAAHLVVKEGKKVAIVSADTVKVGAVDQMRIFSQILNVPFAVLRNQFDWGKILSAFTNMDYILVDFPGVGLKSVEELSWIRNVLPPKQVEANLHLVLSCLTKDSDLTEIGKRYRITDFKDVIFTNIDESTQHGCIYNFIKRFQTGIHSFGSGPKVPEDFEMASKERLLDLIFKLSKTKKGDL